MSEDDREIKVTDKRIFTPEGELREGFEHLDAPESAPESDRSVCEPPAGPLG